MDNIKFSRRLATNFFILGISILAIILAVFIIRYGIPPKLNELRSLSTILIGSVGIIFSFTGIILYFSVLNKNSFVTKASFAFKNFIVFLSNLKHENPETKEFLKNTGIALVSDTYVYLRDGFRDSTYNYRLEDDIVKLTSNIDNTYQMVFMKFFSYVDYILNIIYDSELPLSERKEFYDLLKLNLTDNSTAPIFYLYYNMLASNRPKEVKKKLAKMIVESTIFEQFKFNKEYLVDDSDYSKMLNLLDECL